MNWFKRKLETKKKLEQIKIFDSREEYTKLLRQVIQDTEVDSENWIKSSFITSTGGSLTFVKYSDNLSRVRANKVEIRFEFIFTASNEFNCYKIELKVGDYDKLRIESDIPNIIGEKSIRILYDFYCEEQNKENEKLSQSFNEYKLIIDSVISKSTKRDNKLNSLGI